MNSDNDQHTIEQEFIASWNWIEVFFSTRFEGAHWDYLKPILPFITELRQRGYDKKFRAGQGMARFQLSRSREHGLRRDQSMLGFEVHPQGGMHVIYFEASDIIEIEVEQVAITPEVEELLTRLLSHPID